MHHNDANEFFRIEGKCTDLLIYTMSDSGSVAQAITEHEANRRDTQSVALSVKERRTSLNTLRSAYGRSHGIFAVLFIVGLALTIPAVVVTCGLGQNEMRREMGVLKAIGWPTRALVEKTVFENLAISLAAVCLSVLVCMAWMKGLNGIFLAQFYVAEVGIVPDMEIPSRVLPFHPLLALMFALLVTQSGALSSVWRGTRIPPKESIR